MNKVTVKVEREDKKDRYVLHFKKSGIEWFMFLDDSTWFDPRQLNHFIQRLVSEVQLKS